MLRLKVWTPKPCEEDNIHKVSMPILNFVYVWYLAQETFKLDCYDISETYI